MKCNGWSQSHCDLKVLHALKLKSIRILPVILEKSMPKAFRQFTADPILKIDETFYKKVESM